ncbi:hypothetical protein HSR122_2934 [Halapricum desulfuricans]|uniref:Uncharacterized protein n=1 Tax=Halapricum desulfuricans TaxID=2841257 RepID=A0A897ND16_9EURY|nr:hypothetical protein HSR122_2934 [Halapricum desulfuricans]
MVRTPIEIALHAKRRGRARSRGRAGGETTVTLVAQHVGVRQSNPFSRLHYWTET